MSFQDQLKTRINARIDKIAEEQLRYVTEHTQMNITDALRASIALMYEKVSQEHQRPADILKRGPSFVAMGDSGLTQVSTNYKAELAQAYGRKLADADR